MRAIKVLQKLLRRSIPSIHLKRLNALVDVVDSCVVGGRLTLSALARHLDSDRAVRHRIKRVDRLLGNARLQEERLLFYRLLCDLLIGNQPEPILIVDWSDLKPDRSVLLLRACVRVHGFALPVYEEVHPLRLQNNRRVHREFLLTLRQLLADCVCPIVVADAGFRSTWFEEVERLGWHWVGRIRGRTMLEVDGRWVPCKELFAGATASPQDFGLVSITQYNPVVGRLCRYRKRPKGRHQINRYAGKYTGKPARGGRSCKNARRESEPWLIAASPSLGGRSAVELVRLYGVRMQIEHGFRTLKSHQFGFAFEDSQTRDGERLSVLLLIHALAMLLAWIAGRAAQRAGLARQLRSNVTAPDSLSIITLGTLALRLLHTPLSITDFRSAFQNTMPPIPPLPHQRI